MTEFQLENFGFGNINIISKKSTTLLYNKLYCLDTIIKDRQHFHNFSVEDMLL